MAGARGREERGAGQPVSTAARDKEARAEKLPASGHAPRPLPDNLPAGKSYWSQAPGTPGSAIQHNRSANKVPRESGDLAIPTHWHLAGVLWNQHGGEGR